jgi:hypothetical protein
MLINVPEVLHRSGTGTITGTTGASTATIWYRHYNQTLFETDTSTGIYITHRYWYWHCHNRCTICRHLVTIFYLVF